MATRIHCDGCDVVKSEKVHIYPVSITIDRGGVIQDDSPEVLRDVKLEGDLCATCIDQVKKILQPLPVPKEAKPK